MKNMIIYRSIDGKNLVISRYLSIDFKKKGKHGIKV
jgi:hypothetical protein